VSVSGLSVNQWDPLFVLTKVPGPVVEWVSLGIRKYLWYLLSRGCKAWVVILMEASSNLSQHWSWSLHSVLLLLLLVLVTKSGEYSPVLIAGGLANYGAPVWTYYSLLSVETVKELLVFLDALLNRGITILRQHANRLFWWLYYPSRVRPLRG